jgi:methylenetetrahydrofolate dehydrogenase (NADP+)/methenyltetrahydrofolate cyclohydrolase
LAILIDGRIVARQIREVLKVKLARLREHYKISPGLAVVLVGEDPASQIYVQSKRKACEEVGIQSYYHHLEPDITQEKLLALIREFNQDVRIHGILVQLPLPASISEEAILTAISPEKDSDGFHPVNMGKLILNAPGLRPCTPAGIMELLDYYKICVEGRHAVVVGRSNIVGKPVALMLLHRHATVTICHSRTSSLSAFTQQADILITAIGKPQFIGGDMIKEGAVVVDVGINRVDGKLVGDVDFESVSAKAGAITPVPGGVGPMTIAMLLKNTVQAFEEVMTTQSSILG